MYSRSGSSFVGVRPASATVVAGGSVASVTAGSVGSVPSAARKALAAKVFAHTADYDAAIAGYLTGRDEDMPSRLTVSMERMQSLRYGENPGQRAALYVTEEPRGMRDLNQRQGKELSFNNLLDVDAALMAVSAWRNRPACAVIKHTTPCGIAVAGSAVEAFRRARATDPVSAFGSVVALNTVVDRATAEAMQDLFVEVVVAPAFAEDALQAFAGKKNLRVVELPVPHGENGLDFKRVRGGFLVQDRFVFDPSEEGWRVAVSRWAWEMRAVMREHPWALRIPISGPPATPNNIAWLEAGLRGVRGSGLDAGEKLSTLLLVTKEGAGYVPPPALGVFQDVPPSDAFARWIEELVRRQVTGGCSVSPPLYCPGQPTSRAQMAVFLTTTFGLPLP